MPHAVCFIHYELLAACMINESCFERDACVVKEDEIMQKFVICQGFSNCLPPEIAGMI